MRVTDGMGFVKVHRSLVDWEWYHDDRCVRLFIHLLIKANWTEGRWKGTPIMPGQMITSSVKLADQLGWSRSAVNRTLEKLVSTGEVDIKPDIKWTLVTVANWAKWQDDDGKPDTKPDAKRTRTGHQTGQQPDTIEEEKKLRREEGKNNSPKGEGASADPRDLRVQQVVDFFKAQLGGQLDGTEKENRWHANTLLRRMAKEYPDHDAVVSLKALIQAGREDPFHKKNATNFLYLLRHSKAIIEARKARASDPKTQSDNDRKQQLADAATRHFGKAP